MSIIVVSYNTCAMILDCLKSVEAETRVPYELIVVDNASADNSASAIASAFPDVRLIVETENLGFAAANNLAAAEARGEYLLLLNPDTVVLDGAIDKLVDFARSRPRAKIWGGRTLFEDRSLNPTNCWRRMTLWSITTRLLGLAAAFPGSRVLNPEGYGGWSRDTEREVDIVTGCFFLISRAFWATLGGFDTKFVMYGEEADLCQRARECGARPRITPGAEIVHHGGASEPARGAKLVRLFTAKVTLIQRHFPPWQRPVALALFRLYALSRAMAGRKIDSSGRPSSEGWQELWTRRAEWKEGYPES